MITIFPFFSEKFDTFIILMYKKELYTALFKCSYLPVSNQENNFKL
ncbi:hypothetical protein NT07LI_4102 [Listeria innocua FSL S4-378]|nr:hypothetical protein NT07LI_4102 [Listeria innocua FSL S4-378]